MTAKTAKTAAPAPAAPAKTAPAVPYRQDDAWALAHGTAVAAYRNPDGGFGHYPGSPSDADACFFHAGTLVMAGVSTNVCVESTARHGYMLDYHIAFMGDCCAAFTQAEHDAALMNIDKYFGAVMDADQLLSTWDSIAPRG